MKKSFLIILSFLFLSAALEAFAKTVTATFSVTATIAASACTVTTDNMTFGTYDPGNTAPLRYSNSIGVNCNGYGTIAIYPNNGDYSTYASGTTRAMSNGAGKYLSYDIYTDSTYSTVWNSSTPVTFNILPYTTYYAYGYGQIPAGELEPSANYSDTVTAVVTF